MQVKAAFPTSEHFTCASTIAAFQVLDDTRKWWKARNSRGQVAHVPHTIVTSYNFAGNSGERSDEVCINPLYTQNYIRNSHRQVG